MNALLGVDVAGDSDIAQDLLARLQFPLDKLILAHAVESMMPDGTFPGVMSPGMMGDILQESEEAGKKALRRAEERCTGTVCERKLTLGDPFKSIVDTATDNQVDLIAVTTRRKSTLEAVITGSVTRGLLTAGEQSFLAAKPSFSPSGPLKAVFATDHSEYSTKCADELVRLAPRGIGSIVVASVVDNKVRRDLALTDKIEVTAEDHMSRQNEMICAKLRSVASECKQVVTAGPVNEGIRNVMAEEGADLLILGAQGHGFFERLRSGSVSFHQVVAENYSVLVLRLSKQTR